jgi:rhamnulokinase
VAEATNASTTQLVDVRTGRWAAKLMEAIGDDELRWPPIVPPGTVLGPLLPELVSNDAEEAPMILATCAHDTAAAVAAVPASTERGWAFISSGTWSLVGVELDAPVVTPTARRAGFTNEAGIDGTVRFLKNRAGMWVLEECRREWEADGERRSHAEVFADATAASSLGITIDLNAPEFATRGDMVTKIAAACRAQGVTLPGARGAIVRLILESLATSHADALAQLETVSGRRIDDVHIVGGGALNDLLNQLTADRCGRRVLAGPEEATVLGNLLVQARTLGDLPAGVSIREAARRSSRIREFTPRHVAPAQGSAAFAH